jgi:hypothetical protein
MLDERYQGEIAGEVVNTEHERQRPFMLLRPTLQNRLAVLSLSSQRSRLP